MTNTMTRVFFLQFTLHSGFLLSNKHVDCFYTIDRKAEFIATYPCCRTVLVQLLGPAGLYYSCSVVCILIMEPCGGTFLYAIAIDHQASDFLLVAINILSHKLPPNCLPVWETRCHPWGIANRIHTLEHLP